MFEGIKKGTGPTHSKTAPLKSRTSEVITDSDKQMKRWVEHYLEMYGTENKEAALNTIPQLNVLEELDVEPTLDELEKAISCLTSGKAPGSDGIPPEIIKCGKPVLLEHLHSNTQTVKTLSEKAVPQDMHDSNTINLYRNKGHHSDCNNYQGISLLVIVGKVYA